MAAVDRMAHERRIEAALRRIDGHLKARLWDMAVQDLMEVARIQGALDELEYQEELRDLDDARLVGGTITTGEGTFSVRAVRRDHDGALWVEDEDTRVWHRA